MSNKFLSDYTIIDIETTGLSPINDEIIELSAIKVRENKIVEKFTSLVKPKGIISPFISRLTGITNEMVNTSPNIELILPKFRNFFANDCIIGHNIKFDISFINHNLEKHCNTGCSNASTDMVKLARTFCPNLASYKLSSLAQHYNISTKGHHRALTDCEITFEIYNKLYEAANPNQIKIF